MRQFLTRFVWLLIFLLPSCSAEKPLPSAAPSPVAGDVPLVSFLSDELTGYGFTVSALASPSIDEWTISRDEYGFVVSTAKEAYLPLRNFLEETFPPARFEDSETVTYRDDNHHTTVMLNRNDTATELIVLYWKDPKVQTEISTRAEAAVEQILEGAAREDGGEPTSPSAPRDGLR